MHRQPKCELEIESDVEVVLLLVVVALYSTHTYSRIYSEELSNSVVTNYLEQTKNVRYNHENIFIKLSCGTNSFTLLCSL